MFCVKSVDGKLIYESNNFDEANSWRMTQGKYNPMSLIVTEEYTGRKNDSDKLRWDLLPIEPLEIVIRVLMHGAKEYGDDNWRRVEGWRWRYFNAALRHIFSWWKGIILDDGPKGSGLHHLGHAVACLLFLMARESEKPTEKSDK